jgi:hypothetical protein
VCGVRLVRELGLSLYSIVIGLSKKIQIFFSVIVWCLLFFACLTCKIFVLQHSHRALVIHGKLLLAHLLLEVGRIIVN